MRQNGLDGTEKNYLTEEKQTGIEWPQKEGDKQEGGGKTWDRAREKEKGRERAETEGEFQMSWVLRAILPHSKTLESPLWWWWWKQLVLHRSDASLLFCPLLASLPFPLWTSSHPSSHSPSWVLLKLSERPSAPGPSLGRGGEIPLCHVWRLAAAVVGVHRSSPEVPSLSVKWSGANQFSAQQHKTQLCHCFNSKWTAPRCTWLTDLSVTQQPAWLSLCLFLYLCEFPSDLLGYISSASLVFASCTESRTFTGRVHLGLTQVEHFLPTTRLAKGRSWFLLFTSLLSCQTIASLRLAFLQNVQ